jgi:hypothetical protein
MPTKNASKNAIKIFFKNKEKKIQLEKIPQIA